MKGVIFTEFLSLVEEKFGLELSDQIIESSELESGGAYTTLGTYDHQELLTLVGRLAEETGLPPEELVKAFGHHLIGAFTKKYAEFFRAEPDTLHFLTKLEGHIHSEVRKLYSDTELPRFEWEFREPKVLELTYMSRRPFGQLARGMIEATADYYCDYLRITQTDLSSEKLNKVRFVLEKLN